MSKSIYENAIKVVTYLQEQNSHLKDNSGTIYVSTENITALENLLIHSHKQEKLLSKIKEIIDRQDDSYISSMLEESQKYYKIKELMNKEEENE